MTRHPVNIQERDFGQRAAETMQRRIGSWKFLIIQSAILFGWIVLNVAAIIHHWDPYPFILLNLALSFQAAYTGPILLIANNRSEAHARDIADRTYQDTELLKQLLTGQQDLVADVKRLLDQNNSWTLAIHKHLIESGDAPDESSEDSKTRNV